MIIDEVTRGLDLSNPNVDERDSYFCRWFKGSTAESGSYAEALLELVDTKKELQKQRKIMYAPWTCKMDAGDVLKKDQNIYPVEALPDADVTFSSLTLTSQASASPAPKEFVMPAMTYPP